LVIIASSFYCKVITSLSADKFGAWEEKKFAPEADFLEMLGAIDGVSVVETQTYTVSRTLDFA